MNTTQKEEKMNVNLIQFFRWSLNKTMQLLIILYIILPIWIFNSIYSWLKNDRIILPRGFIGATYKLANAIGPENIKSGFLSHNIYFELFLLTASFLSLLMISMAFIRIIFYFKQKKELSLLN